MPVVSNHGEINNVSEISKELKELSAAELLSPSRRYLIFNIYTLVHTVPSTKWPVHTIPSWLESEVSFLLQNNSFISGNMPRFVRCVRVRLHSWPPRSLCEKKRICGAQGTSSGPDFTCGAAIARW